MTRIEINGFGRIGRIAFRAGWDSGDLSIVHVNEIQATALRLTAGVSRSVPARNPTRSIGKQLQSRSFWNAAGKCSRGTSSNWARSALMSLIPTTTGSATAVGLIYPELQGKLNGIAVRVPLLNASLTDCVFEVRRNTDAGEVNQFLRHAADTTLKGILGYEERPLVSIDFLNDPRSAIVDALSTMVIDGTQVKILAWYDNEWGYANRMIELAQPVASRLT